MYWCVQPVDITLKTWFFDILTSRSSSWANPFWLFGRPHHPRSNDQNGFAQFEVLEFRMSKNHVFKVISTGCTHQYRLHAPIIGWCRDSGRNVKRVVLGSSSQHFEGMSLEFEDETHRINSECHKSSESEFKTHISTIYKKVVFEKSRSCTGLSPYSSNLRVDGRVSTSKIRWCTEKTVKKFTSFDSKVVKIE